MNQSHIQIKKKIYLNNRIIFVWALIIYDNGVIKAKTINGNLEVVNDIDLEYFTLTI